MSEDGYIYVHMAPFYFYYVLDMQGFVALSSCGYITNEDREE